MTNKFEIGDTLINLNKGGSYGNICTLISKCPFLLHDETTRVFYVTNSLDGYELYNEKPQDTILEAVKNDLTARSERGVAKYGTTLDSTDLTQNEWLQHAYEEALDFALYLKKLINETNTTK